MTRVEGNPHPHMASRLFDWGCWQKLLVGTGICRVPTCIGGTSTVVATERHFGIKTHSSGGATPDRPTSDGPEGSNYSSSEDRLFQLRRAEKIVAVFAGISLLVGYVALKSSFSGMSANKREAAASDEKQKGLLRPLVMAGPSGAGKSTLLKMAFKEYPNKFGFSVSHTTRKPRPGEVDGREYHFVSLSHMEQSIKRGLFIEHAKFSGNMYGTSKAAVAAVRDSGMICVLDIDMQGVRSVKATDLNPVFVLIKPPSLEVLEERLRGRGTETEESIQKRLTTAKEELEYAATPGVFDYVIVNEKVEPAFTELCKVLKEVYGDALK